jgi:hypothetical protein
VKSISATASKFMQITPKNELKICLCGAEHVNLREERIM